MSMTQDQLKNIQLKSLRARNRNRSKLLGLLSYRSLFELHNY